MRRLTWLGLLVTGVALAADTGLLNWTQPQNYTDGAVLTQTDIAQTNLRCSAIVISGVRTGCSLAPVTVPGLTTNYAWNFTFTDPKGGQICFQAQTQLVSGALSDWSTEACKTVQGKVPRAPILVIQ
jgi:hypothetical protein